MASIEKAKLEILKSLLSNEWISKGEHSSMQRSLELAKCGLVQEVPNQ